MPDMVPTQITIKATNDHMISPITRDLGCQDRLDILITQVIPPYEMTWMTNTTSSRQVLNDSIQFTSLTNIYLHTSPYDLIPRWSVVIITVRMFGFYLSGLRQIPSLLMYWLSMMAFLAMVDVLWLRSMAGWILSFFPVTPCPLSPLFLTLYRISSMIMVQWKA